MRALVATGDSKTPLEMLEVDEPVLGEGEVLVDVRAMSVNRGELRLLAARPPGWRPGQDVAGVVSQAAAEGGGPPVASRVVAMADQAGWAENVAVRRSRLAVLPDSVSFQAAATLP